jgi:hypothetical protein
MLSRFLIASPTLLFLALNLLVLLLEPCSSRRTGFCGLGVGAVDGMYTEGRRRDAIFAVMGELKVHYCCFSCC